MTEHSLTTVSEILVVEHDGEPRARDVDIGERLGFARPRAIRQVIERNRAEIEAHGPLATACGKSRGQEFTEYLLTEEQALAVATLSSAPNAAAVRAMLIRTFVAWRKGHLEPTVSANEIGRRVAAIFDDKLKRALATLLPSMIEARLEADDRAVAVGFKPALAVLVEKKVPTRRRRAFSQKASSRLRRFSTANGYPMRISRESGRYLFHIDAINGWLAHEGEGLIRDHVASVQGQGVLHLVPSMKAR